MCTMIISISFIGDVVMLNYLLTLFFGLVMCATTIHKNGKIICTEIPHHVLEEVLGAAFNPRYMSLEHPVIQSNTNGKRTTHDDLDFYVDNDLTEEDIEERPAWQLTNHIASTRNYRGTRSKRNADLKQQWHCKSNIKWTDLGPDYFPRYLRSVECLSSNCWFNLYKCRPRSFAIKILRRKRDKCVTAQPGTTVGNVGLPKDLKEMWVWEERAISFCCDCTI